MIGSLGAGVVAGLGVAMPLGAIGALLVGLPARAGHRVAVAAALGVATTDAGYATVAVLGGASAAGALRHVQRPLQICSAAILVAIAAMTLLVSRRPARSPSGPSRLTPRRAYLGFIALTAVNPATLVYFVALVLGADGSLRSSGGAWFVGGVLVSSAAWQLLLVGGGAALAHVFVSPKGRTGLAIASALLMLGLAVRVAAGAF